MRTFGLLLAAGALVVGASVATASDARADVVLGFGISGSSCCPSYYPARPVYVPTYSYHPTYSYYPARSYYPSYRSTYYYPRYRRAYYPAYRPYYRSYRPYVSTGIYFGSYYGHRHYGRSHRYYRGHRHSSFFGHRSRGSRRAIGRRR